MAEYITVSDVNVALNGTIPFNTVSIPCNTGNVIPAAPGVLILKGNTTGRFARYEVRVQGNIAVPTDGEVTPIALAITLDGAVLPESVSIFTPQAVEEYGHINTVATVTIPCGCCMSVSGTYTDGTEDDPAVTPTPSIAVRRGASISAVRIA
jgi:hypothetical protein